MRVRIREILWIFFSNTLFYYFSLVYNCNYNADIHRCAKSKAKKCNTQKKGTET